MHKNAKRNRNNSKFKHDTHAIVTCSLYVNVLAIQTPSFPSATPFCLSKHNEKNQVYHKQFTRKNRVGCDIKYLGAPSCLAYAASFIVYSPPPPLEQHLRASFSRRRANFFCHRGNIYLPAPSLLPKATFPLFLLAFQVQTFTAAYWQLSLLTGDPSSCSTASSPATLLLEAPPTAILHAV